MTVYSWTNASQTLPRPSIICGPHPVSIESFYVMTPACWWSISVSTVFGCWSPFQNLFILPLSLILATWTALFYFKRINSQRRLILLSRIVVSLGILFKESVHCEEVIVVMELYQRVSSRVSTSEYMIAHYFGVELANY